jgi:protein phosphatase 1 regulatory subunit 7
VNLKVLDISFNEVLSLEGISVVTSRLQELYVQKNEVAKIEELEHLQNLRVLELGSNKIRVHISPTISDTYWL